MARGVGVWMEVATADMSGWSKVWRACCTVRRAGLSCVASNFTAKFIHRCVLCNACVHLSGLRGSSLHTSLLTAAKAASTGRMLGFEESGGIVHVGGACLLLESLHTKASWLLSEERQVESSSYVGGIHSRVEQLQWLLINHNWCAQSDTRKYTELNNDLTTHFLSVIQGLWIWQELTSWPTILT